MAEGKDDSSAGMDADDAVKANGAAEEKSAAKTTRAAGATSAAESPQAQEAKSQQKEPAVNTRANRRRAGTQWPPETGEEGELFDGSTCLAHLNNITLSHRTGRWVAELRQGDQGLINPPRQAILQTWSRTLVVIVDQIDPLTIGPGTPAYPIISGTIVDPHNDQSTMLMNDAAVTIPMSPAPIGDDDPTLPISPAKLHKQRSGDNDNDDETTTDLQAPVIDTDFD